MQRKYKKNEQTLCQAFLNYYNTKHATNIVIDHIATNDQEPDCVCSQGYALDTITIYPKARYRSVGEGKSSKKLPNMYDQLSQKEQIPKMSQNNCYILIINALNITVSTSIHYEIYFNNYSKSSKYDEIRIQSFKIGTVDTVYTKLYPTHEENTQHTNRIIHGIAKQRSDWPTIFAVPVLTGIVRIGWQHTLDPQFHSFLSEINVGIHEIGHPVFGLFGNQMLQIMGGTLMQLLVPLFFIGAYIYKKKWFPVAICIGRLATNFFYISTYMYDATRLALPMLSASGNIENTIHDWNYMFGERGVIMYTDQISARTAHIGTFLTLLCLFYGSYLIFNRIYGNKMYSKR